MSTVMIIDDSLTVRMDLDERFRAAGYETCLCKNAHQARRRLLDDAPALIVLDVVLPDADGVDLLAEFHGNAATVDIPIVMLSTEAELADRLRGLQGGADEYVGKPYDGARLIECAQSLLEADDQEQPVAPRILVIDDSLSVRHRLADVLEDDGYRVDTAESGEEGLEVAERVRPAAIIVDNSMPGIDGTAVIERVRMSATLHPTACLLLTGSQERRFELRAQIRRKHYEEDNRRIRDELLRMEMEARAARDVADAKASLLRKVEEKNDQLAQANRDLERAKQQAEQESKFKSKFLASVSHELRTPLNAIIGFSELLARQIPGPLEPTQLEYVSSVLDSGKHLLELINEVLDLSKIEAGKMRLRLEWFDVNVLAETVETVGQPLANQNGVALNFVVAGQLPQLHGDPTRVKQILHNLVANAIKFTPEGGRVDVSASHDDDEVVLEVADTGVGISDDDRDRLFREFEQLEAGQRVAEEQGTGLGLALTKRLVDLHGGRITVDSQLGVGSTFRVYLPVGELAEASATNEEEA